MTMKISDMFSDGIKKASIVYATIFVMKVFGLTSISWWIILIPFWIVLTAMFIAFIVFAYILIRDRMNDRQI